MRIAVPILAILVGLVFIIAVFTNPGHRTAPAPALPPAAPVTQQPPDVTPDATAPGETAPDADAPDTPREPATAQPEIAADQPRQPAPVPDADAQPAAPAVGSLTPVGDTEALRSHIGSLDPQSGSVMQVTLTGWGAALYEVKLTDLFTDLGHNQHYQIQRPLTGTRLGRTQLAYPFAALSITVNGQWIDLSIVRWRLVGPGHYEVDLVDDQGQPVLHISRQYVFTASRHGYDISCLQQIRNLSDQAMQIVWEQYAQSDLPPDDSAYLGDMRMIMAGYLDPIYDPMRRFVFTDGAYLSRREMVQKGAPLWPASNAPQQAELTWVATMNRYFAAAVHPILPDHTVAPLPSLQSLYTLGYEVIGEPTLGIGRTEIDHNLHMLLTLTSRQIDLPPHGEVDLSLGIYTGPRLKEVFRQEPYHTLSLGQMVRYEIGCTWCTFQWLARFLLRFLEVIHWGLRDWGLAIIILVLVVRLILHPITKRAQINMAKMQKQMASLQPDVEKLKKKYADDQQKLNQEMMKLYREKGVNFTGCLGFLPMLLQMPIWVALYAMLYFAIELRHEPAFYGIFQWISASKWQFLADLSSPDRFLVFFAEPRLFHPLAWLNIPIVFDYSSLNVLPLLMGFTFYAQMKYMSPPPANEQMAQQQKMMKYMMLLFPIFLYSAPSGLTLYMMASSWAGIIDGYIVRQHIKQQEEAGTLFQPPKPRKPGGLFDRIQKAMEAKQRAMTEMQKKQQQQPPKRKR